MAEDNHQPNSRGARWLAALTDDAPPVDGFPASVRVVDASLVDRPARYIAVVPDPDNHFPRARQGEVGLLEGWSLARAVRECVAADADRQASRVLVAVIDVPSQAYGRAEEGLGIHQALAAAADAYATAREAGHPILGLIVGKAMSGAFLAHGYQANRLLALDDAGVQVQAMGKQAAARVTQRTVEDLESLAETITPMAYDIASFDSLGLLHQRIAVADADTPTAADIEAVRSALESALSDIGAGRDLSSRLDASGRKASVAARERLRAQWRG